MSEVMATDHFTIPQTGLDELEIMLKTLGLKQN